MKPIYSDAEIAELLACEKLITVAEVKKLKKAFEKKKQTHVALKCGRRRFRVLASPNAKKPMKFSIILQIFVKRKWLNLIRCNGHHGPHPNRLEQQAKSGVLLIPKNTCHIHRATERYQMIPEIDPEWYAEPTTEYSSFLGAVEYMCESNSYGIRLSDSPYESGTMLPLFKGEQ